jgi:EmrB/QacA subfamily drug resistance transporter
MKEPETEIDYSRKWYVLAAVGMGILLATIDGSIVNVALPTLVQELDAAFAAVQWVVLAYLLTLTTLLLSMGRLGDMLGKKPIYIAGFVVFTLGSALCGLAPSVQWLIAARVLQALGGSMILSLGMAIVTESFPPSERGKALGISGTMVSIGIVLGPTLGGLILSGLSWHWIFFVNLPVGLLGTLVALRYIPALRPSGRQRFDLAGAAALFGSLLSLLVALTLGQQIGFSDGRILLLLAAFAAMLAAFVAIERRSSQPMIDLKLFRNKLFSANLVSGFTTFVSMGGTIILIPFFLEGVLGYGPRQVGLLMATVPLVTGIVSPLSGALSDRYGTRPIAVAGLVTMLLGFLAMSTIRSDLGTLGYVVRYLPVGLGMGIFQSPNNSAVMGAVPRHRLGVASGLLSITRTLGQVTGIAVLGALWAGRVALYSGGPLPAGASSAPAAAQVAALHDTFLVVSGLIAVGLAVSVWGLIQERRMRPAAALEAQP